MHPFPPCAALALTLLAALAPPAPAQGVPDLSGSWLLKADEVTDSTAPADSGAAGPASDLRPVLRRGGKPEAQEQLTRLVGMAQPVPGFAITQTDSTITFTNQDGFTYTVRPDGTRDSIRVGEESIWVRARWRRRALEVEFRPPGGGRIIETYQLADSGVYLRLEVVVEHDLLAQRLWRPRMYRLAEAGARGY